MRAVIIHAWDADPEYAWYPYVKSFLSHKGFRVQIPFFLDFPFPSVAKRVAGVAKAVGEPDESVYLIGHSLGCATILRYLETLKPGQRIGGAIFVAGFADSLGYKILDEFFTPEIDFGKLKKRSDNFTCIFSYDDPYVPADQAGIFAEKLSAQLVSVPGGHHFTPDTGYNRRDLPEVIQAINQMAFKTLKFINS